MNGRQKERDASKEWQCRVYFILRRNKEKRKVMGIAPWAALRGLCLHFPIFLALAGEIVEAGCSKGSHDSLTTYSSRVHNVAPAPVVAFLVRLSLPSIAF